MNDPERADRIRDRIAIDKLTLDCPSLPVPFTGPDQAAFYFIDKVAPEVNRASVAEARRIFAAAFGVTFGWRDEWSSNGPRRLYRAFLPSGLAIVITARASDMPKDEDGAEVRELEGLAA